MYLLNFLWSINSPSMSLFSSHNYFLKKLCCGPWSFLQGWVVLITSPWCNLMSSRVLCVLVNWKQEDLEVIFYSCDLFTFFIRSLLKFSIIFLFVILSTNDNSCLDTIAAIFLRGPPWWGMRDLSLPIRDWTHAPYSGRAESSPLEAREAPCNNFFKWEISQKYLDT